MEHKDLVGKRFGRLVVVKQFREIVNGVSRIYCTCKCDCGNEKKVRQDQLLRNITKSCSCLQKEIVSQNYYKYVKPKHPRYPTNKTLAGMIQRCYNPNCPAYKDYGNRGIYVYSEWLGKNGKKQFYEWAINNGWEKSLTIERIDVNKGYTPDNCKFIPMEEQANNRRSSYFITIDGVTKNIQQWCDYYGINRKTHQSRVMRGMSPEEALLFLRDNDVSRKLTYYKGEYKTLKEWCETLNLNYDTIRCRIGVYKWNVDKAFETPIKSRKK